MKIAITGKGGVGKTTLSAMLSHIFSEEGKRVIAVDADPDANLGAALGIAADKIDRIKPIAEMADLIEERTGARPGSSGGVFKLNPRVDDIPDEFGYKLNNIIMLIMGRSKEASAGCYCPENVFLKRLLGHLIMERDDLVIVDIEAGIEHLTRGTSTSVDAFIVVVEPGQRSVQTALTVKQMAEGLGIQKLFFVANKVRGDEDIDFIKEKLADMIYLGAISFSDCIMEADMKGLSPYVHCPHTLTEVMQLKNILADRIQ